MTLSHLDVYRSLNSHKVRYLVIGGLAVNLYGLPRSTKDMDIFIEHQIENCKKLLQAFKSINLGTANLTDAQKIFDNEVTIFDDVIRIDVLPGVKGLEFVSAWEERNEVKVDDVKIRFVSFEHLIQSTKAVGRKQDLEDLEYLFEIKRQNPVSGE